MSIDWKTEGDACVRLLGDLLRIDTVNRGTGGEGKDDGHENVAADRLASFLREVYLATHSTTIDPAKLEG